MGKKKQQYDGGHYSRRGYSKEDLCKGPEPQGYAGLNRHALYESAVQSPKGDISYLLCFYQRYVGQQVPEHLREDFCGTALLASTWCRGDPARRTGMGLDIDRGALSWGMQHNGEGLADTDQPRLWLLHGDVMQPLDKAVLVNCPASSLSSNDSQPSVEQAMQGMSIHATGTAANGVDSSSSSMVTETADAVQTHTSQADQSIDRRVHRDSGESSAERHLPSDHSSNGLDAALSCEALTEHETVDLTDEGEQEGECESKSAGWRGMNVKADACRAADIICAFNFSVCLLHQRSEVQAYFRQARQALSMRGGILVMDLLGGHAAEDTVLMHRHNDTTGARFVWEQEGFNPVTRHIHCYITLRDPDTKKNLRRAFQYHWRLWTIPELQDMLLGAGFSRVYVWLRPMQGVSSEGEDEDSDAEPSDSEERGEDFEEYDAKLFSAKTAELLSKGWTAFVIGVAEPHEAIPAHQTVL